MSKIPKEIVDKIEQRNKLNEEIETWCKEHLDMDGLDWIRIAPILQIILPI